MSKKINDSINQIESLIYQINEKHNEEADWKALLDKEELKDLDKVSLVECHVIDYIGKNRLTNAVNIANYMNITKGGISKIMARLLKKNLIEAHRLEDNRKEIFYTLTISGKRIFSLHEKLHVKVQAKLESLLKKYNKKELNFINDFVKSLRELM